MLLFLLFLNQLFLIEYITYFSRSAHSGTAHYGLLPSCAVLLLCYARLLVRSETNNAETKVVVPVVSEAAPEASVVAVPVVHIAAAAAAVIAATTEIAAIAAVRANIPTPLPDIAAHVI